MHDRVHIRSGKQIVCDLNAIGHQSFHEVGQERPDAAERHPENECHDDQENRDSRVFPCKPPIRGHAPLVFPALMRAHDGPTAKIGKKGKPHIRKRRLGVQAAFLLHRPADFVKQALELRRNRQLFFHQRIMLDELGGGKSHRKLCFSRQRLQKMRGRMDAAMHGGHGILRIQAVCAEINARRLLPVTCNMERMLDELVNALILGRRDWHYRDSELFLQLVDMDRAAIGAHFVHHIECQDHGDAQLHELHGQIKIPL